MMVALKYSVVLFGMLFVFQSTQAQVTIALAYDSLSSWTTNNFLDAEWQDYQIGSDIRFGFNENATVWCKVRLDQSMLSNDDYLCFNNNHLDSIVIFHPDSIFILGDRTNKLSPFVSTQAFAIQQLPDSVWFYTKVKKGLSFIDFSIDLKNEVELIERSNQTIAVGFLYFGIAFLLIVINVFLWLQKKEKRFIYYVGYSTIGILYVFVNLGLARYVFPDSFIYTSEIRIYSGSFWFLMLGYFIIELLNLKVVSPEARKLFRVISNGTILLALSGLVMLYMKWYNWVWLPSFLSYILFFVMLALIAYCSFISIRLKNRMGYYVLFSFFPHSVWALSIILVAFNVVNLGIKVDWIGLIMLYETVLFGWILFSEYIEAFKRNNELKEQIIANDKNILELTDKIRLKERNQLASLLHDKFGIDIANIVHLIEVNRNDDARLALTNLGKDLRELSHTILPVSLKDGALVDAVRSQVQILNNQQQELRINFNAFDFPELIPEELAFMMYLSTLELIQNAIIHSGAKEMDVEFFGYKNELVFSYSDDGVGFNTITEKGFGITNIENRVNEKGGQLSWSSNEHSGTQLLISIPSDYQ
jgi:signal transduction histidine kinase